MVEEVILGGVVAFILLVVLLVALGGGGKKNRFDGDGDDYFRSSHRHNGKMPDLLLAPYRVFGPALIGIGLMALVVTSLLIG